MATREGGVVLEWREVVKVKSGVDHMELQFFLPLTDQELDVARY
jgi:hypothetical protein